MGQVFILPEPPGANVPVPSVPFIQIGVFDVNLQLPINGLWVADIITDSIPQLANASSLLGQTPGFGVLSTVYLDLGGDWLFVGKILRYGVWRDTIHFRMVGASAGLSTFPGSGLTRQNAPWASVFQALLLKTDVNLSFQYGTGFASEFGITNLSIAPSGTRSSATLMNTLTGQINKVIFQQLTLRGYPPNLGVPQALHWRSLPISQQLNPLVMQGSQIAGFPIALVYDLWNEPTGQALAPAGGSYTVDVNANSQAMTLATANTSAPWSVQPLINGTATLRDMSPETGIESYGVEYPVLLPGNWYNSPIANYTYNTTSPVTGGNVQALDVEYRFRDNKLEMTIRNRSAFSNGSGQPAYIAQVAAPTGGQSGNGGSW